MIIRVMVNEEQFFSEALMRVFQERLSRAPLRLTREDMQTLVRESIVLTDYLTQARMQALDNKKLEK